MIRPAPTLQAQADAAEDRAIRRHLAGAALAAVIREAAARAEAAARLQAALRARR